MRPTRDDVHIDRPLSNLAVNYRPQQFVADMVMPFFRVTSETDKVWKIDRSRLTGNYGTASPDGLRSLRAEDGSARTLPGFGVSTDTYRVEEYALNAILFDRIRDRADSALALRQSYTEGVVENLRLDREFRVKDLVMTDGNWAETPITVAVANKWSAPGTDITNKTDGLDNARVKIRKNSLGMAQDRELKLLISWELWIEMKRNTVIQNMVKQVQTVKGTDITPDLVAQAWNIGEIIIAGAYFNSAGELITETITDVWDKEEALLFWNPPPSMVYKGMGMTFTTRPGGFETRTWRDEPRKGEFIEPNMFADEKIVNNDVAVKFKTVFTGT